MIKENKGISLISLIITIAVMMIIGSITINITFDRFEINNLNKMINDLELLEDKVSNYYLKYNVIPVVRDGNDNTKIIKYDYTTLDFEKNAGDNENYYIIDLKAMEGIALNYGREGFENPNTSDDVYIINEKSHQIYYVRGIELDGEYYHSILDNNGTNVMNDIIPPTKPEIKMIAGEKNEEGVYTTAVSIEFVPGKDNGSGIEKTTYAVNDEPEKLTSTLLNNTLTISDNGTYNIKARSYDIANNVSEQVEIDINIENEENKKYRFITKWNVTLGEIEGNQTYSTVVLPVNKSSTYDATIYWGDGTSTLLQHKTNGITLTDAELIEKVTHNYTLVENDDSLQTIEIEGTYTDYRMGNSTSTPTKLKLTGIEQWGNTGLTSISFNACTNLSGIIPKNDLTELNCTEYCFNQTSITGLEEGFCFSGGNFSKAFRYCYELEDIPNSFVILEGVTDVSNMFNNCTSLESLPNNFCLPNSVQNASYLFYNCSNLIEIPESFKVPEKVTAVNHMFAGCTDLQRIPEDFSLPEGATSVSYIFNGCKSLENIPDTFNIPEGVTSVAGMFINCIIKSLPSDFKIPYGVTDMINTFNGCAIESFPENFEIPETVTNMNNAIRGCLYLKGTITIKANPTSYTTCFGNGTAQNSGGTLTVNYSKNCTNIDAILATGNASYVVKGEQID